MRNLKIYEQFCLDENEQIFFSRHNMPTKYKERAKKSYNLSDHPSVLQRTHNFFQGMEDRINNMARIGKGYQQQRRAERGGGPNTGVESLFGIASVVPNVLKRVFGPSKFEIAKKDGGYIYHSDHSIPHDVSLKQCKSILALVNKYGRY